jgi:uncharacterized membrane protein YhdT
MVEDVSSEDVETDPSLIVCKREAKMMLGLWLVQSVIMVGIFLLLGYNRTDDPLGFPMGLPSWFVLGGIVPAIVFLFVVIYLVWTRFTEVDLK